MTNYDLVKEFPAEKLAEFIARLMCDVLRQMGYDVDESIIAENSKSMYRYLMTEIPPYKGLIA